MDERQRQLLTFVVTLLLRLTLTHASSIFSLDIFQRWRDRFEWCNASDLPSLR